MHIRFMYNNYHFNYFIYNEFYLKVLKMNFKKKL